jgi:hypothetical protein
VFRAELRLFGVHFVKAYFGSYAFSVNILCSNEGFAFGVLSLCLLIVHHICWVMEGYILPILLLVILNG